MNERGEKLLMAKELVDRFETEGVRIHYAYARAIICACPAAVRRRYIKFSDAWTFWVLHPSFQPFSEKEPKSGTTRDLSSALDNTR